LYVAGYLRSGSEDRILAELSRLRPAAVVVLDRPDGQEPTRVFGADYGRRTRLWLEELYEFRTVPKAARIRPDSRPFGSSARAGGGQNRHLAVSLL
jgi:hypothetical protein